MVAKKSFTYLRRGAPLRKRVDEALQNRLASGSLVSFCSEAGDMFSEQHPDACALPRCAGQLRLLSPFDNLVIQRERLSNLFAFDYQIECYVPSKKRKYGYFCLPILAGDQLVGRLDATAKRDDEVLMINALHLDAPADDMLLAGLYDALLNFARFNRCAVVNFSKSVPSAQRSALETIRRAVH